MVASPEKVRHGVRHGRKSGPVSKERRYIVIQQTDCSQKDMEFVPQTGASDCHQEYVLYVLLGIQGGPAQGVVWRLDGGTDRGGEEDNYITDVIDRTCVPDNHVCLCLV